MKRKNLYNSANKNIKTDSTSLDLKIDENANISYSRFSSFLSSFEPINLYNKSIFVEDKTKEEEEGRRTKNTCQSDKILFIHYLKKTSICYTLATLDITWLNLTD